jgi:hypothetical protein
MPRTSAPCPLSVQNRALVRMRDRVLQAHDRNTSDGLAPQLGGRSRRTGAPSERSRTARHPRRRSASPAARPAGQFPATSPSPAWLSLPPRQGRPSGGPVPLIEGTGRTGPARFDRGHHADRHLRRAVDLDRAGGSRADQGRCPFTDGGRGAPARSTPRALKLNCMRIDYNAMPNPCHSDAGKSRRSGAPVSHEPSSRACEE